MVKIWLICQLTNFNVGNGVHQCTLIVCLSQFHLDTSASHRHDAHSVLGVLVEFDIANVVGGVLLRLPP